MPEIVPFNRVPPHFFSLPKNIRIKYLNIVLDDTQPIEERTEALFDMFSWESSPYGEQFDNAYSEGDLSFITTEAWEYLHKVKEECQKQQIKRIHSDLYILLSDT